MQKKSFYLSGQWIRKKQGKAQANCNQEIKINYDGFALAQSQILL